MIFTPLISPTQRMSPPPHPEPASTVAKGMVVTQRKTKQKPPVSLKSLEIEVAREGCPQRSPGQGLFACVVLPSSPSP